MGEAVRLAGVAVNQARQRLMRDHDAVAQASAEDLGRLLYPITRRSGSTSIW